MILVISSSLNPDSRSRILATATVDRLEQLGHPHEMVDLQAMPLPFCDGGAAYCNENVEVIKSQILSASAILLAAPIYNYHINAAAKNLVELTGQAWTGKVVGLLFAAGGHGSYMSGMGLANSLMLDFRCLIIPRFVYTTGDSFAGDQLADDDVQQRVFSLVDETVRVATALSSAPQSTP